MLPLGQVVHQLDGLLDLEVLNFLMMNAVVPTDCQVPLSEESFLLVQVPLVEKSVLFFLMAVHMGSASVEILALVPLSAESFLLPDHELILLLGQNPPLSAKENENKFPIVWRNLLSHELPCCGPHSLGNFTTSYKANTLLTSNMTIANIRWPSSNYLLSRRHKFKK